MESELDLNSPEYHEKLRQQRIATVREPIGRLNDQLLQVLDVTRYALTLTGEIWECGVCRGITSRWIAFQVSEHLDEFPRTVRLFDTFEGRPEKTEEDTGPSDTRFNFTSLEYVQRLVPWDFVKFHKGVIPESFVGLEDTKIAFAYIDLDLYKSTRDALEFVLPRLEQNGIVIVDDYNTIWTGVDRAVQDVMKEQDKFAYRSLVKNTCLIRHKDFEHVYP